MVRAHIRGWGMYTPTQVQTNDDLARVMDTSDEWIRTRTGIGARHIAGPRETTATMGIKAGTEALAQAGVTAEQLDLIIVATASPDRIVPPTACHIQAAIGAKGAAFDLSAGCSGFVYALTVAAKMIEGGAAERVLVIGAETLSHIVDPTDRNTAVIFGDGAGAFYLEASDEPGGLLAFDLGAEGAGGSFITGPIVGNNYSPAIAPEQSLTHVTMNGRAVYQFATRSMAAATKRALEKAGFDLTDIDLFIPHQANIRIIENVMHHLALPAGKIFTNIEHYGNTSSASIPIAWCEAYAAGRFKPGDLVVMTGVGSGLTWGTVVTRWIGPAH